MLIASIQSIRLIDVISINRLVEASSTTSMLMASISSLVRTAIDTDGINQLIDTNSANHSIDDVVSIVANDWRPSFATIDTTAWAVLLLAQPGAFIVVVVISRRNKGNGGDISKMVYMAYVNSKCRTEIKKEPPAVIATSIFAHVAICTSSA